MIDVLPRWHEKHAQVHDNGAKLGEEIVDRRQVLHAEAGRGSAAQHDFENDHDAERRADKNRRIEPPIGLNALERESRVEEVVGQQQHRRQHGGVFLAGDREQKEQHDQGHFRQANGSVFAVEEGGPGDEKE